MATTYDDLRPEQSFRLSDLWTNERSRSLVIQIFTLIALLLVVSWIINNTIQNLENLGVETGYDFLNHPASYDINQRLIEYTSRSTHARAALVGFLNTILVAVTGIIFATGLGFVAGVLRLSRNWLVRTLMASYIEFTRNVPLLLQILLWYGVVVHVLPPPKQAIEAIDGIFLTNRGFYIPRPQFDDMSWIILAVFVVAVVGVKIFSIWARRIQEQTGKIYPVFTIGAVVIVLAPVIAYFASGSPISLDWPELKGLNFKGGLALKPEFFALWFALSVYTAAFIAEIVRSGILAVSHGQTEASFSLGLKPNWTMRLVIIPQALRVIVPPLISQYLNLTKNSSLAIAVGYMDLTATIGKISLNQTGRALECMSILLTTYLMISLLISLCVNIYNRRIKLVER